MTVEADYYDGKSSQRQRVLIDADQVGGIRVAGESIGRTWPLRQVRISPRVGDTARHLYFPDGSQCETIDNNGIDRLVESIAGTPRHSLHRLERSGWYVLLALGCIAFAAWIAIAFGIPGLAKHVAFRLPPTTEAFIGKDALQALDQAILGPSRLPADRQVHLRKLFAELQVDLGNPGHRLELRAGNRLGANALALPAGIVVVTDELAQLAQSDAELTGVLAHEVGHIRQRHALRSFLQSSATALLIAVAVGDLTSITSLAAALPTVLLQAKYSRQFETEADDFALAYLARRGIPSEGFADLLDRMDRENRASDSLGYLSTHPATRERTARAREKR